MRKLIILETLLVAFLASCGLGKKADNEKISIMVSIEPQRYFVEKIAGDKADVQTLVPNGARPETYDLTPSQLVGLAESDAYFMIGTIEFERAWADSYTSEHPHTNIFDLSDGVNLILSEHSHCNESMVTDTHNFVEPHIWMSLKNSRHIVSNILKGMVALDPDNKEYYQCRYDSVMDNLNTLEEKLNIMMEKSDTAFMIYHPALSYFARDYGLTQISIESDGKEPSPSQLAEIIKESAARGVRTIFIQPEFDPRSAEVVAEETGAELVPFNPLSYEWMDEMTGVVEALSN